MALDKNFLKYKLEKIKNDRIFKDQDTETKKRIRKENAKYSAEEADAIHSYLTGEDNIDALDNKSYLENRLPGSLFLIPRRTSKGNKWEWQGELNIRTAQTNPNTKKNRLLRILKRFKTVAKSNVDSAKQLVIFKKIFDSLNLFFSREEIKVDGNINARGYKTQQGKEEYEGISEDFLVTDTVENTDGTLTYMRKRIIVKNGLIVGQEIINQ